MSSAASAASDPRFRLIDVPCPFPPDYATDQTVGFGIGMRCIHNVYIRALNSMWENALIVLPQDEAAFIGFAQAFCAAVHSHHHGEEEIIFPFLETKVSMQENVAQHALMTTRLVVFEDYVNKVAGGNGEKYDGEKVRELLEGFGDVLVDHLHDEIPTISPEILRKFDKKALSDMLEVHGKHVAATPGKFTVFPLIATHHNWNELPQWGSEMPGPVLFFIRYIAPLRYPSYWKFSSFTMFGKPQTYSGKKIAIP